MSDQNNNNNSQGGQLNIPFPTAAGGGWFTVTYPSNPTPAEESHVVEIDLAVPVEKKKINKDGCRCKKCKEFYPYAEANQEDGTMICYTCRKGW